MNREDREFFNKLRVIQHVRYLTRNHAQNNKKIGCLLTKMLAGNLFLLYYKLYYLLQRPDAPQGSTSPFDETLTPISSASTCPPNLLTIAVLII